ncbi:MAG: ComF family protein [Bacteroides sp.]|nr:ComF family protein [Bacteroides sp.]MDD2646192.1 ComF family protein [Bacteroides sp.]MDD4054216.1 ComF family protein [Bacteroides sp.]MDD4720409.1 ComF family protein [Bacteroides sp.]NLI64233.1 ComF family protein [Bacteroidales bacterium]
MVIKKWISSLLSLFFPRYCTVCKSVLLQQEDVLCLDCAVSLPRTQFHLQPDNAMEQLFWGKVEIRRATSFFYYRKGSRYKQLLYQLKYKGRKEIGESIAATMTSEIINTSHFFDSIDVIIPVPLHPDKLKLRGYNQSEWIAKGVSRIASLPINTKSLIRNKYTETQTQKSVWDRQENIKDVFQLVSSSELCGKHVLLIDDVVTTGATLTACATVLSAVPKVSISFLTLAMVEY